MQRASRLQMKQMPIQLVAAAIPILIASSAMAQTCNWSASTSLLQQSSAYLTNYYNDTDDVEKCADISSAIQAYSDSLAAAAACDPNSYSVITGRQMLRNLISEQSSVCH